MRDSTPSVQADDRSMSRPDLTRLAESLRPFVSATAAPPADDWEVLLPLVLERRRRGKKAGRLAPVESPVLDPQACADLSLAAVEEELRELGYSEQSAPVLLALSRWRRDCDSARSASDRLEHVKGVGRELADRIRLFVLGESVAPVGRAQVRICCRHGWLDMQTELDDWQSTLRGWADGMNVELSTLIRALDEIGARWCGPRPKCLGCPLEPLLPDGGPIEE